MVELGEHICWQFPHGVDQHIQAATVGHANHHLLNTLDTGHVDQLVHGGDKAFTAFQGEALLAHVFGVQITL